ncbi:MAG TPA: RbsD/FucU domain-containing protein [Burkholderiaceae bacterium]|nr:RbsD/FucU domain-containing protein [Burkholderiaceae bacterium]
MLKGIDPLLTPDLLKHLCAMGHGEWVAVVDANFTADWLSGGKPVVRLPGHSLERVARAVLSVFPLATDVHQPAGYMQHVELPPGHTTAAQQAFIDAAGAEGVVPAQVEAIERFAFYERVKAASLIVQSGEATAYGNAILCKGVILPPSSH